MSSQREDGLFIYIYVNTLICDWLVTFLYMFWGIMKFFSLILLIYTPHVLAVSAEEC